MAEQARLALAHPSSSSRAVDRWARGALARRLEALDRGRLTLVEGDRASRFPSRPTAPGPEATVRVHDPEVFARTLFGGTLGFAEAYLDGVADVDDIVALARLFLVNRHGMDGVDEGLARLREPLDALYHAWNRNTRAGSRRNIAAHYDLGNDFFRLFLDDSLMYSSAIFPSEEATLEEAQRHRLEVICRKLDLRPEDHLLEIGTGWGGLALHAAREHGCRVTTTTVSREQHALARERVRAAGLDGRVEVLLTDYRDLDGTYDKLVSIEMVEAVGHQYLDGYFEKCASLLAPEGSFLLQAITIQDAHYERARDSVDFMKRHIFPGCCIPSVAVMAQSLARTDLRIFDLEDIGDHYARTLREWRARFESRLPEVRALGFDERFVRAWRWYLASSEAGFAERFLGDVQILAVKPGCRRPPLGARS